MDTRREAEDVHDFPLEKKAPDADRHIVYWPLTVSSTIVVIEPTPPLIPRQAGSALMFSRSIEKAECGPDDNTGRCEKPASARSNTIPIVVGVTVPVVVIIITLIILHRRHVRKTREEDANDRHASLDFGLGQTAQSHRQGRKGNGGGASDFDMSEKPGHRGHGMSLEINSPYLLPPGLNDSSESLHSLSRNIHNQEDPYRPVTSIANDNGSIRSGFGGPKRDGSSIHTGRTGYSSKSSAGAGLVGNASQMGRVDMPSEFVPPPRNASLQQHQQSLNSPGLDNNEPTHGISPIEPAYFPNDPSLDGGVQRKAVQNPEDSGMQLSGSSPNHRESHGERSNMSFRLSNNYLGSFVNSGETRTKTPPPSAPPKDSEKSPFSDDAAVIEMPMGPNSADEEHTSRQSLPSANSLAANTPPLRMDSLPQEKSQHPDIPQITTDQDWAQGDDSGNDGFVVTPPSPTTDAEIKRASRYSMDVPPEEYAKAGLGAPGVDPRRISMGFRPLPPTLAVESDDPEIRANRIRSFYKEYFDDSKPAPAGEYYEDYDDGSYYEPANNHEMPYHEPVTRRAMTPPPGAGRFVGQQPPRAMHGSMAQNNYRPGPGYGPGPGHGPPPPRAFHDSMGGRSMRSMNQWRGPPGFQEPRPFSSASNRRPNTAQRSRPLPPLDDLSTIPTPALLKDDAFALTNAADFAPPISYKERAQGRSQSPMGERRAYKPTVPVHRPLVSAFDELATVPSPHLLRKSGTFTSLDFAPPKRVFRDNDTMSDAGSIRSNRSGISHVQLQAIRGGAHRVSRIPGDQVFAKDDLSNILRPTWGQRSGN